MTRLEFRNSSEAKVRIENDEFCIKMMNCGEVLEGGELPPGRSFATFWALFTSFWALFATFCALFATFCALFTTFWAFCATCWALFLLFPCGFLLFGLNVWCESAVQRCLEKTGQSATTVGIKSTF